MTMSLYHELILSINRNCFPPFQDLGHIKSPVSMLPVHEFEEQRQKPCDLFTHCYILFLTVYHLLINYYNYSFQMSTVMERLQDTSTPLVSAFMTGLSIYKSHHCQRQGNKETTVPQCSSEALSPINDEQGNQKGKVQFLFFVYKITSCFEGDTEQFNILKWPRRV